jgi:predicted glycoside hydrolase/deacetylase ChbG (UPF0249 family)
MAPSLARRLGFADGDRVAVIHCDDIGMCRAANEGAFEALAAGPATCGSLMVPCPAFDEAAAWARAHPGLDLGVHLTLNAEWAEYRWGPLAGAAAVPSLVDAEGCLPRSVAELLARARPEEVEIELRAQVERALAAGVDVTHLDAHMGAALLPPFVEIYVRLACEYRLPLFAVRPDADELARRDAASAAAYARALGELDAHGVPCFDAFDANSLHFEPDRGLAHNAARISGLCAGVTYLICHPARGGDELSAITPDAPMRDFERRFYGGAEARELLAREGVATVGMRRLRDQVRGA